MGPLSATLVLRIESRTCGGSGVPNSLTARSPACWTSQSNCTPVASRTRTVASQISGPTPSPGTRVTACLATPLRLLELLLEVVGVDLDEVAPLCRHLVLGEDGVDRARIHASAAVDALVGIDVVHVRGVVGVDAVDRADLYAGRVLHAYAGLDDHISHVPGRVPCAVPAPRPQLLLNSELMLGGVSTRS